MTFFFFTYLQIVFFFVQFSLRWSESRAKNINKDCDDRCESKGAPFSTLASIVFSKNKLNPNISTKGILKMFPDSGSEDDWRAAQDQNPAGGGLRTKRCRVPWRSGGFRSFWFRGSLRRSDSLTRSRQHHPGPALSNPNPRRVRWTFNVMEGEVPISPFHLHLQKNPKVQKHEQELTVAAFPRQFFAK